ncbi:MAG: hypothetical protein HRU09_15190 [Oligoflexales bacterium]|nr:hypothetical protein [Oligoflexales bacterium]
MVFGLIMLALSCMCAYMYFYHIKGKLDPQLASGKDQRLAEKAAAMRAKVNASRPRTLTYAHPGSFVKLHDVGLRMLNIDGTIKDKHLYKHGMQRWHELILDEGSKTYALSTIPRDDSSVLVSLRNPSFAELGVSEADFYQIKEGEQLTLSYEGTIFNLTSSASHSYCPNSNELEGEPCLIWSFADGTKSLYITIVRWQNGAFTTHYKVRVPYSQVEILSV